MPDDPLTWRKKPKAFTRTSTWWIRKIDGTWWALAPIHVVNGRRRKRHHFPTAQAAWAWISREL